MRSQSCSSATGGLPPAVVTAAIRDYRAGVPGADDRLWELVYPWFHRLARVLLAHDGQRRHLDPEDLLHDAIRKVGLAYLREPDVNRATLRDWLLCSMRQILIDSSHWARVREQNVQELRARLGARKAELSPCERLDLEDRLTRLQQCDRRAFDVLEMWVFGHKSLAEIAALRGYSASKAGNLLDAAFSRMRQMDGHGKAYEVAVTHADDS